MGDARYGGDPTSPRGFARFDSARTVYVGQLLYDRLYVGHLKPDTDERTVRKWFEAYGPVTSVKLIYDKETGRSKGFGFVSFESDRDARDALNDANGRDLDGAKIRVNFAHGGPHAPGAFGGRGRGRDELDTPRFSSDRSAHIESPHQGGGAYGPSHHSVWIGSHSNDHSWGRDYPYGGRGVPYRPPHDYKGIDRRLGPPGGAHERYSPRYSPGRYSPGRYSPRDRSRSPRSRSRSRSPAGRRYDDRHREGDRRHSRSPSRDSHASGSSGRSPSPSRRSASRSRSRSRGRSRGAATPAAPEQAAPEPAAPEPAAAANGTGSAPPSRPPSVVAAAAPTPPQAPGSAGGAATGGKAPPSAEAVKKEMMRLRKMEKELGARVQALQDELARQGRQLAQRERDLAQREHDLADAQQQLQALQPQLGRYQEWVAALLSGAAKAASSRAAAAAAAEEATRQEEALAALRLQIEAEAVQQGLDVGARAGAEDDDAMWEQLAADIQASEQIQRSEEAADGAPAAARDARPSAEGRRGRGPEPPATAAPQQAQQREQQEAVSDEQLQAAMQEAAMEEEDANAAGWAAAGQAGNNAAASGSRWHGMKLAVPS